MSTTRAYICFNLKKNDAVAIGGHLFFSSVEPIENYINSGSEWVVPEDLEPRTCEIHGTPFDPYTPPNPSEAPDVLLSALPEP